MSPRVLAAFIATDVLVRFRRLSTFVLLAVMIGVAWAWIPDPASGRALIVINDQRALYTAGTIGMATASVATLFVGLFGFYAVSNAVNRDLRTRVGQMLASTPLASGTYLFGRFLGNLAYLGTLLGVFAIGSFLMMFARGEGSFDPLRFISQYVLICGPALVAVSALAIFFEVTPFLRSRAGDVCFFILWVALLGVSASAQVRGSEVRWFDLSGLGWMMGEMRQTLGTTSVGIGATRFDPSLEPIPFDGIPPTAAAFASRTATAAVSLVLLPLSLMIFHRFDPAKVKSAGSKEGRPVARLAFLGGLVEWLTPPRPGGVLGAALWDARLTLLERPLGLLAVAAAWIAAVVNGKGSVAVGLAAGGLLIAGVAARERMSGTTALLAPSPVVAGRFGLWKMASSLFILLLVIWPMLLRLSLLEPGRALRLAGGLLLIAGLANTLGVLTGGPRTFVAILLAGVYVAMSSGGVPELDFGGLFASFDPVAAGVWALMAILLSLTSVIAPRLAQQK